MYENVRILGVGCFQSASIHGRVELSVDLSVVPGRLLIGETHLVSWLIIPIGVGCFFCGCRMALRPPDFLEVLHCHP